jgi:hypothetical protein
MKAIQTKYLPCTNTKGSRIKAWTEGGNSITIGYPHELPQGEEAHKKAAEALKAKLGWVGCSLVGGGLSHGRYCFVMIDRQTALDLI